MQRNQGTQTHRKRGLLNSAIETSFMRCLWNILPISIHEIRKKQQKNIGSWSDNSLQETLLPVTFHDRHCRNRHFGHKVSNARAKQNTIEPFTWNIRGLPNGWKTDNCNRAETLCLLLKRWTCVSCVSAKRATSKGVAKPTFTNFPTFTIFAPLLGWLYLSA